MRGELVFHPEMELLYRDAENSSERQIGDIEYFINNKVDLLIVSPNETDPITPVVEKAFQSGIPVIMVDRKINSSMYSAYIGANNYEVGKLAGNYIADILEGNGSIVEIWGLRGSSPAVERHQGLWEVLAEYPGIKLAGEIDGKWEQDTSKVQTRRRIADFAPFDLVFAHNDVMAYGAYTVCREILPGNKIKFVGIDALPGPIAGTQFVADNILTASFLYPTGGEESIRIANQILKGLPYEKENTLLSTVIDSKNVRVMKLQYDKLLSQQNDIVRQQGMINEQIETYYSQRTLILILLVTLIIMIVAGAIAAYNWREKNEINKRLEAKRREILDQRDTIAAIAEKAEIATQEKLKFFTNISHEFKTPLTLIMGPIEELLERGGDSKPNLHENLLMIRKNAMRLLRLVNQLMDFRKIEDRKMLVKASELDIVLFIGDMMAAFEKLAQKRKMDFRLITEHKQLFVWFDPDMLDKVIFNLLSNAFKFTNDQGRICVGISIDAAQKNVIISIEDNGLGMSEEHISHAFDRFYTGENLAGNGIGLSLSKEFIELHHGELTLRSEKGQGTRFCIMLPVGNAHFDEQQLFSGKFSWQRNSNYDVLNEYSFPPPEIESLDNGAKKEYTVLLIDDNSELRQFIRNRLQTVYNIEEAHDGVTGLRLAFEIVPDLIICDVMLPGKGGFEVVKKVKEDLRTSHIPTIILTAKGSIEQRIVGIQSGADEYIAKPFVLEYLYERIKALIRSREQLKEHYSHDLNIEINTGTPGSLDKKFINDFTAMIEKHIANSELHVNDISRELGMSRVQVYRKVKALLGYSVNDYIVSVRLKKAKHLLLNTDKTIAEISTEVGFSSPTYFSTSFKFKFNLSPRDFKASQTSIS
ncbi:MAG TPA: substrate-binding domain-containing protein [Cyclobacteriaceae bacterium]|nr:substrate-binding domain-containing protein [Cyclobacteriaceae bacterium]